jgi:hypothetical protein
MWAKFQQQRIQLLWCWYSPTVDERVYKLVHHTAVDFFPAAAFLSVLVLVQPNNL